MITDAELEELYRLEQAATKGPWHANKMGEITQTAHVTRDVWHIPRTTEDSEFMAAARNAFPRLLAEVKRLRSENLCLASERDWLLGWKRGTEEVRGLIVPMKPK